MALLQCLTQGSRTISTQPDTQLATLGHNETRVGSKPCLGPHCSQPHAVKSGLLSIQAMKHHSQPVQANMTCVRSSAQALLTHALPSCMWQQEDKSNNCPAIVRQELSQPGWRVILHDSCVKDSVPQARKPLAKNQHTCKQNRVSCDQPDRLAHCVHINVKAKRPAPVQVKAAKYRTALSLNSDR